VSELVVFVFRDQYRAPEVLNELRRRDWPWVRDLDDAVAVTLNEEGKARVHLSIDLSKCEAAGWARMWRSLLSSTLFLPFTGVMVEVADGIGFSSRTASPARAITEESWEAKWWRDSLDLSVDFKRDVAALIGPNGSAIFMLLHAATVSIALKQLRNYGDTIVHTSLSAEQDDKMLAMLAQS
jgi:uncharacterized membrane protein